MDNRNNIIEKATELFVRYGLKSVRMDDIASHLGISKRTIYECFEGGREELIKLCAERYYIQIREEQKNQVKKGSNILEEIMMYMDSSEEDAQAGFALKTDLQRFYPHIFEELIEKHKHEGLIQFKKLMAQGIREGIILPDLNIVFTAAVMSETLNALVMKPESYLEGNISVDQAFKYIILYFLRGISTAKGMRIVDNYMKNITRKE